MQFSLENYEKGRRKDAGNPGGQYHCQLYRVVHTCCL